MTEMSVLSGDVRLTVRIDGDPRPGAPTLLMSHALGSSLGMWDPLLAHLPPGLRLVRYDSRGHGRSDVPPAPYAMGALVADAEAVADAAEVRNAVVVGLSLGGMVAQGLAVKRPDVVRALVLSNTAAKIGTRELWEERIARVRADGMAALAEATLERWFTRAFREGSGIAPWREAFLACPVEGYAGCAAAIAGSDFLSATSGLRCPTLAIAGSEDGSTPPDLVRETADLIPGARFVLIRRAGHLPHVEQPEAYAEALLAFLAGIGELPGPV